MRRLLALTTSAVLLAACDGPYRDIEQKFKSPTAASAPSAPIDIVVLTSAKHGGAYNYNKVLTVALTPTAIEMAAAFPLSIGMDAVSIPATMVSGCSETCFGEGAWDADVLIASTGTQISFRGSQQVIEWCWANRIPMISGKDKRGWMYSGSPLPARSEFVEQLSSRELYNRQAKQSCLGY